MGAGAVFVVGSLLLAVSAGCDDGGPPHRTEVVVVIQSDLAIPSETDGLQVTVAGGDVALLPTGGATFSAGLILATPGDLPVSILLQAGPVTSSFSMTAQLLFRLSSGDGLDIVVQRSITAVRFSPQQTMMLLVPMLRACACQGTACPGPGNPDCDALQGPALQPFDPAIAPADARMPFGTIEVPAPDF